MSERRRKLGVNVTCLQAIQPATGYFSQHHVRGISEIVEELSGVNLVPLIELQTVLAFTVRTVIIVVVIIVAVAVYDGALYVFEYLR